MAAHRRVDAHRRLRPVPHERIVKLLAHALEPLEFIPLDAARPLDDRRQRQGVVRGELRKHPAAQAQQLLRAGHVVDIRHRLAREHGEVVEAALLRALDLGVPIRALHETHVNALVGGALADPVDHVARALLVGLHGEAQRLAVAQAALAQRMVEDVETEFEAIGFFRVDRQRDARVARKPRKLDQPPARFPDDPRPRDRLEARMERGELHRYGASAARVAARIAPLRRCANGGNRLRVRVEIALRVGACAGAFAQHVERIPPLAPLARQRALERVADGLADDEMRTHDAHRLPRRDAHSRRADAAHEASERARGRLARAHDAPGERQRPHGCAGDCAVAPQDVMRPVALPDLVLDEQVRRRLVGNAQQRFRQHHQRDALGGRQGEFVQEVFDPAHAGARPDSFDEAAGLRVDARLRGRIERARRNEAGGHRVIVRAPRGPEWRPRRVLAVRTALDHGRLPLLLRWDARGRVQGGGLVALRATG